MTNSFCCSLSCFVDVAAVFLFDWRIVNEFYWFRLYASFLSGLTSASLLRKSVRSIYMIWFISYLSLASKELNRLKSISYSNISLMPRFIIFFIFKEFLRLILFFELPKSDLWSKLTMSSTEEIRGSPMARELLLLSFSR